MTDLTPDRTEAIDALDRLGQRSPDDAATVGRHMEYLEDLNDRLARNFVAVGQLLEDGKRDLMRAGWVSAWIALRDDPDLIDGDPSAAFNDTFNAMKDGA